MTSLTATKYPCHKRPRIRPSIPRRVPHVEQELPTLHGFWWGSCSSIFVDLEFCYINGNFTMGRCKSSLLSFRFFLGCPHCHFSRCRSRREWDLGVIYKCAYCDVYHTWSRNCLPFTVFGGVRVHRSFVYCAVFSASLFFFLSFFFWP
jgi:hypothetical protein